jgi:hypothetical protein
VPVLGSEPQAPAQAMAATPMAPMVDRFMVPLIKANVSQSVSIKGREPRPRAQQISG